MPGHRTIRFSALVLAGAACAGGCSTGGRGVAAPPVTASATEVAHAVMAAYQAGDSTTLRKLTAGTLQLQPDDLGRVTHVRWHPAMSENQTYPGFARGAVQVTFDAVTSGSSDGTIPADSHWAWGFVLARRSPTSRWLAVDDGVA